MVLLKNYLHVHETGRLALFDLNEHAGFVRYCKYSSNQHRVSVRVCIIFNDNDRLLTASINDIVISVDIFRI